MNRRTSYHAKLAGLVGRTGKDEAAVRLKRRILSAIARVYPWLAEECARQAAALEAR